ncbi:MAG: hypothetical protein HS116_04735 [Planctomycetes bacterium]|nr:hypothetical protein [Planctomycetota bacterium]
MAPAVWFVRAESADRRPLNLGPLIERLSDADPERRAEAFEALRAAGPMAWPQIVHYGAKGDLERAAQIRALAAAWDIPALEGDAEAERLEAMLFHEHLEVRKAGFDGLWALGPEGERRLKQILVNGDVRVVLRMEVSRTTVAVGERLSVCAHQEVIGEGPFWENVVRPYGTFTSLGMAAESPFGDERPRRARRRGIRRGCGYSSPHRAHPMNYARARRPGRWPNGADLDWEPRRPGYTDVRAWSRVEAEDGTHEYEHPFSGRIVPFKIGGPRPEGELSQSEETRVFALPAASQDPREAELLIAGVRAEEQDSAEAFALTVTLATPEGQAALGLEDDLARYAWYAWVDERGEVCGFGSWLSASAEEYGEACRARIALAEKPGCWRLNLPKPPRAGAYALWLGYEAESNSIQYLDPCYESISESSERRFEHGELYTKLDGFVVER